MNNVHQFPAPADAPLREVGPLEAEGELANALRRSLLSLDIAQVLHQAAVLMSHGADVPFERLSPRTHLHFRELAEQTIKRLDPVAHRLAVIEAEKLLKDGRSFEFALNGYFAALVKARA